MKMVDVTWMKSRKKQGNSFGIDLKAENIFYYLNDITDVK